MIKKATKKDIQILDVLSQEIQDLHNLIAPNKFKPYSESNMIQLFTDLINNPKTNIFIAYHEDQAAGYIITTEKHYEESPNAYAYSCLFVNQISVHSKFRGQGLGRKLTEHIVKYAKKNNFNRIELDTWTQNENAKGFFKKVGFQSFNKKMSIDL